jgi:hypothetical protein
MNLDDYKTGQFDSASPINQIETDFELLRGFDNLTEAFESGHIGAFKEIQSELLKELEMVYYALKSTDNAMQFRILDIIEKTK